jgi:hypothetical protein
MKNKLVKNLKEHELKKTNKYLTSCASCFIVNCVTGTGTIALDPTFGSFTLLGESDSLVKVFRLFRLEWIFLVFRVWTQYVDVQHLIYWHGQRVCDALFASLMRLNFETIFIIFNRATNSFQKQQMERVC